MTWLMEILKISLEEQLLIKYCIIKHLILLKFQNMMDIKEVCFFWWFINVLSISGEAVKNEIVSSKELAEQLHKPIIRKINKGKVHLSFIVNIWGVDIADMQVISKFNKGLCFFIYVLLIFSVITHGLFLWKIKKVLQILMLLKKI